MAFADYLDLQTAVVEQVANPAIADVMPRLVQLAEARLNRDLRTREMMAQATLTIASGTAALPADFIDAIGLFDAQGREYVQQPVHALKEVHDMGFYAISGASLLCRADGDKVLDYYAKIPTLTASMTATNWLLARYPGLYLYAVSTEAAKYLRNVDEAQAMRALYDMELSEAKAGDAASRYSRARVTIQGVTP
jgi:hypothetical protein